MVDVVVVVEEEVVVVVLGAVDEYMELVVVEEFFVCRGGDKAFISRIRVASLALSKDTFAWLCDIFFQVF